MVTQTPSFGEPKLLIDGELLESENGKRFESNNPATGELLTTIPRGKKDDVDRAVAAASDAAVIWKDEYTPADRADRLYEFADVIRENADRLGTIDAAESGNPVSEMQSDAVRAAEGIEMMAGLAREIKGDTIPIATDCLDYTLEQPYGVVGRIIPYNHPVMFGGLKIAAPLVAGNTIVLKPPEQDSTGVLEIGRLIAENNLFPDGVVNVVSGYGPEAGSALVTHEDVRKVGFTGSVETGSLVMEQAANSITDVILELGGKNFCRPHAITSIN